MYFERGIRMNAGKNIAKFRKEKELNQEELAQKINISAKAISIYENN
ncbi:MAG: helix-turn-helix transcriptional regulator [Firmicutes bacterium]|jgi:DNA-binding helix-turn-helix protein|nr:helix-turn-helix transcriptional regulator [Bacillota bacterium]